MRDHGQPAIAALHQPHSITVGNGPSIAQRTGRVHAREQWCKLGPLEGGRPARRQVQAEDRFVDLHPLHAGSAQARQQLDATGEMVTSSKALREVAADLEGAMLRFRTGEREGRP